MDKLFLRSLDVGVVGGDISRRQINFPASAEFQPHHTACLYHHHIRVGRMHFMVSRYPIRQRDRDVSLAYYMQDCRNNDSIIHIDGGVSILGR